MRGRRGHSSSSATRQQSRMALRKQLIQNISPDSQQQEDNTQEDGASADTDNKDELSSLLWSTSSAQENRQKEGEIHSKRKEMTEEEMMDLAVRLSRQEASNTALKKQQENEDLMKAIQESMVNQAPACLNSPSKPQLDGAPVSAGSRRKLAYSNGGKVPEEDYTSEGDMNSGHETVGRSKKRKRDTGSPLLEMPDLSQTQKISSRRSPCSPESFPSLLDSPQSSDSTHIDDSQAQLSPVFPLTGSKAEVRVYRLNQDLVETCKSSGFVLCSQDSLTLTQNSAQPRSPIFPQSNRVSCPKSPVFPEDDKGHERQSQWSPKIVGSPVVSRTAECEISAGASKQPPCENAEFCFSSQESLNPTVGSSLTQSPVFPKSPSDQSLLHKDPDRGQVEQSDERSGSPAFGLTEPQRTDQPENPTELRASEHDHSAPDCRKGTKCDGCQTAERNKHSSKSEELNEKPEGCNSAETEPTSDTTPVWSDQDKDDVTPAGPPSPVFPEEKAVVPGLSQPGSSPNHLSADSQEPAGPDCSLKSQEGDPGCDKHVSSGTVSSSTPTSRQQVHSPGQELHPGSRQEGACRGSSQPGEPSDSQTIHYYWGVPFCPRGLDPDTYTQVIVAQMEVYEKSLKQAQRGLLRKAEWGEAVQPQPEKSPSPEPPAESSQACVPRRRGLRLRGSKRSKAADFLPDEEEEKKDEEQQQEKEEEKEGDQVQTDTDDCEVCPETQLSDNGSTKFLSLDADAETKPQQKGPELPEITMILRDDSPTRGEPQELEQRIKTTADSKTKEDVSGCREDAGGQPAGEVETVKENRRDPDVEEMESRGLQRSDSPELEAAVVPHSPETSVDCPICQGSFPASEIEMHAAYCEGEVAMVSQRGPESQHFQDSVKPRRKRMRKTEAASEETAHPSDDCRSQEKCFICQKSVPLKDFSRHTELCFQRGTAKRAAKGNLLSALERTESRDSGAGPSGSKVQPEAVIDLRDDDDDDEEVSAYRISDSPIRSFTPISEATGCLIDFRKQQRTKKPSQRRR
ncbi:BRCA1-A complex subunit RAP80 isoform X2 [Fundulus heteroclitus]|uniref:BRCA1-A complex subunit RAP80 isoform X2 n=1 Tax=Fundulus heteroclitus TaxID=8078 RepID=UPI00165A5AD4|nr:BRCA1-A complex subunit RAP80 isoform X2 [Fundulus heteroclitus]